MEKNSIHIVIFFLSIFFLNVCHSENFQYATLKTGDIIFRKENSFLSDRFEKLDGKGYSHIGLIYIKKDNIYVVHIERTNDPKDLKIEPIAHFLNKANKYIIKRVKGTEYKDFTTKLNWYIRQNINFDMHFDNKTDNELYCTEFVYKFYYKNMHIKLSKYNSNFGFYSYISIGSIINSPYLEDIISGINLNTQKQSLRHD